MKIVIGGDLSVTEASRGYFENADYVSAFNDVIDCFKMGDRIIINLECALTDSENSIRKLGPNLKGPKKTADALTMAGITDCVLSNNHIFDFGIEGINDTVSQLERCGIAWTGFGDNYENSRKNLIISKDGQSIAIINVCEHEYTYATETRMGARPFDEFETMEDIREAKKSADYVIVIYHGGKEHCQYPSPRLRKACREMVRCGADAVICQHSHCIGCYEKFDGAHILYGQGNFHFPGFMDTEMWNEGMLIVLDIEANGMCIDFVPIVVFDGGIETAKGERKEKILNSLWTRSEKLKTDEWKEEWHNFCVSMYDIYKKAICNYAEDDDLDKIQLFAHFLDCEAHTDVWRELFPTWNKTNEA